MIRLIYEIEEITTGNLKDIASSSLTVDVTAELDNETEGEILAMDFIKKSTGLSNKINIVNKCKNPINKEKVDKIEKLLKAILSM